MNSSLITNNENKVILATSSCIGEGFDEPALEILFLTMPISAINRIVQYTGRLHKKEIIVYDYVDENFRYTRNIFEKRKKTYKKIGYKIVD